MTEPHPKLIELVTDMGFQQHPEKPKLYRKEVTVKTAGETEGVIIEKKTKCYVDYRQNPKGVRYCDDKTINPDDIPELINFKERRDALLAGALTESHKKQAIASPAQSSAIQTLITKDIITEATKIAKTLVDVIEKTKMFKVIGNKKYVYVDGWETLGAMMHCRSEITQVMEYKTGFMAFASIYDANGNTLSKGSAICTRAEKNWKDRDEYAIYSMAQTRALGKAYRLGLSWVMSLAGYESCPAEEVDSGA